jgi:hypothetical protein
MKRTLEVPCKSVKYRTRMESKQRERYQRIIKRTKASIWFFNLKPSSLRLIGENKSNRFNKTLSLHCIIRPSCGSCAQLQLVNEWILGFLYIIGTLAFPYVRDPHIHINTAPVRYHRDIITR